MAEEIQYRRGRELLRSLIRFPDVITHGLTFLGAIGGVVTAADLYLKWVGLASPLDEFRWYLWISFSAVLLLFAGWATLAKKVYGDFSRLTRQLGTRDDGIRLQHEMAEVVRACADAKNRGQSIDFQARLERVGTMIKQYLAHRLPGKKFFITVKLFKNGRLYAVFRDAEQDRGARKPGDDIPPGESCIYMRFRRDPEPSKQVLVRDVSKLDNRDAEFLKRAKHCGFQAVIGFPLRNPGQLSDGAALAPLKLASLMGFLSIDSPTVGAFDGLFKELGTDRSSDLRNDGSDLEPLDDMNLFWGLADSIATIAVLDGHPAKP